VELSNTTLQLLRSASFDERGDIQGNDMVAARLTVMLHVVPQLAMKTSEARLSRTASLSTKEEIN